MNGLLVCNSSDGSDASVTESAKQGNHAPDDDPMMPQCQNCDNSLAPADAERGKYNCVGKRKKLLPHFDQAGAHWLPYKSLSLGNPCEPNFKFNGKCGDTLTKNELFTCHELSYGTIKLGEAAGKWSAQYINHGKTQSQWVTLMQCFVRYNMKPTKLNPHFHSFASTCEEYSRQPCAPAQRAGCSSHASYNEGLEGSLASSTIAVCSVEWFVPHMHGNGQFGPIFSHSANFTSILENGLFSTWGPTATKLVGSSIVGLPPSFQQAKYPIPGCDAARARGHHANPGAFGGFACHARQLIHRLALAR
eukprot:6208123-Pleurochrysis_carterae.AAC.2